MIQKMKGTEDILPNESYIWQHVEDVAKAVFDTYQIKEIRTPIFEAYELFKRSVGETTDVVSKEMYDFMDKGERHNALRPEGTAGVVRSYIENKLFGPEHANPLKVFYIGPMFRYERPQAGRQRQFHQIGVEVLGSTNPAVDVETMASALDILSDLGIENVTLYINSLGKTQDRYAYRQALIDYFLPLKDQLSEDSQRRLLENPLRVLDSKNERDKALVVNAPTILDYLSDESKKHFEEVQQMLTALEIPFKVNPLIVRGLDYYQDTIFEIVTNDDSIGAQSTLVGGGRYDGLVEMIGGPQTPGFGFAMGMERLILTMKEQSQDMPEEEGVDIYVMGLGQETNMTCLKLVQAARSEGLTAERDFHDRSLKSQFKTAGKLKAKLILTVGERELEDGTVQVKNQANGKQTTYQLSELLDDFYSCYLEQTVDTSAIDKYFRGE
ncbi:histidine--tRNA ligase [Vaginisenegalia massiliensis]|uniref:histidine--tRNA ligase n=1 Tax=Vaginisenegalia massiliensis TaxID=2058294 RepID=UPI000F529743|nr:histidine--tRNA ligase [Vaginisenegalia massiliensis]